MARGLTHKHERWLLTVARCDKIAYILLYNHSFCFPTRESETFTVIMPKFGLSIEISWQTYFKFVKLEYITNKRDTPLRTCFPLILLPIHVWIKQWDTSSQRGQISPTSVFQITGPPPSFWLYENGMQITEQWKLVRYMTALSSEQNKEWRLFFFFLLQFTKYEH